MADITRLTNDLAFGPQVSAADFAELRAQGFASVLNARPDAEEGDFPRSDEARSLAEAAGLAYGHVPAENHGLFEPDLIDAFERALIDLPKPIFAHCKSGTRAAILWALVAARYRPVEEVIGILRQAGQDLSFLEDELRESADAAGRNPLRLKDDALLTMGKSKLFGG